MSFNSLAFVLFLLPVLILYYRLQHKHQNILLIIASYGFYGYWDWRFLGLLLVSTIIDYCCSYLITIRPVQKKIWLCLSVVTNLSILGFFKYFDFFSDSFARALGFLGFEVDAITLNLVLPIGISFYTFQSMAYTIDVYRGKVIHCRSFFDFVLYVSFFPQLMAGPIERAKDLLPQLQAPRRLTSHQQLHGLFQIALGYYLKLVVADNLSDITANAYDNPQPGLAGTTIVLGTLAATFQVYCDFAGYSLIALGLANLLGIKLTSNFHRPYLAWSPQVFWRRWHVTLSNWIHDYVFSPLKPMVRSRGLRTVFAMILFGLWHGAAWHFVIWGLCHGVIIIFYQKMVQLRPRLKNPEGLLRLSMTLIWFGFWFATAPLFMAKNMVDAGTIYSELLSGYSLPPQYLVLSLTTLIGPIIVVESLAESKVTSRVAWFKKPLTKWSAICGLILAIMLFGRGNTTSFVYFAF